MLTLILFCVKQVYALKIQIPSLELILTYDKDSIDVNGKSPGYSKPKLVEVYTDFTYIIFNKVLI